MIFGAWYNQEASFAQHCLLGGAECIQLTTDSLFPYVCAIFNEYDLETFLLLLTTAMMQWLSQEDLDPNDPENAGLIELLKPLAASTAQSGQSVFRINAPNEASMAEPAHAATKRTRMCRSRWKALTFASELGVPIVVPLDTKHTVTQGHEGVVPMVILYCDVSTFRYVCFVTSLSTPYHP